MRGGWASNGVKLSLKSSLMLWVVGLAIPGLCWWALPATASTSIGSGPGILFECWKEGGEGLGERSTGTLLMTQWPPSWDGDGVGEATLMLDLAALLCDLPAWLIDIAGGPLSC